VHKRETSNAVYALVRSKCEHFQMYLGQQQDHDSSLAMNSTPTDQPHAVVLSQQCGTTRSRQLADRSCCRDAMLEAGWQKSIRYCGAWLCMQPYIMTSWCSAF